jgi:hypothetical protein
LTRALEGGFDLIRLDIMLPARGSEQDRIAGLNMGADDYLPKHSAPRNWRDASDSKILGRRR